MPIDVAASTRQAAYGSGWRAGTWVPDAAVASTATVRGTANTPTTDVALTTAQAAYGAASSVAGAAVAVRSRQSATATYSTALGAYGTATTSQAVTATVTRLVSAAVSSRQRVTGDASSPAAVRCTVTTVAGVVGTAVSRAASRASVSTTQRVAATGAAVRAAAGSATTRQSIAAVGGRPRAERRCLVFHPHRQGFTHYADYGYDQFFEAGRTKYGVRNGVVHQLTGTTGAVSASVLTTKSGGEGLSNVGFGYATGSVPDTALLTAITEAGTSEAAQYQRTDAGQTHRGQFARGLRGIYWQVQLDITSDQKWSVQDLQPLRSSTSRRVGA